MRPTTLSLMTFVAALSLAACGEAPKEGAQGPARTAGDPRTTGPGWPAGGTRRCGPARPGGTWRTCRRKRRTRPAWTFRASWASWTPWPRRAEGRGWRCWSRRSRSRRRWSLRDRRCASSVEPIHSPVETMKFWCRWSVPAARATAVSALARSPVFAPESSCARTAWDLRRQEA